MEDFPKSLSLDGLVWYSPSYTAMPVPDPYSRKAYEFSLKLDDSSASLNDYVVDMLSLRNIVQTECYRFAYGLQEAIQNAQKYSEDRSAGAVIPVMIEEYDTMIIASIISKGNIQDFEKIRKRIGEPFLNKDIAWAMQTGNWGFQIMSKGTDAVNIIDGPGLCAVELIKCLPGYDISHNIQSQYPSHRFS